MNVYNMKSISKKYGFQNVWTVNGTIFAITNKGVEKINIK